MTVIQKGSKKKRVSASRHTPKDNKDQSAPPERPAYLYKYKSIDDKNEDYSSCIFTHNELYFCSVKDFNDPLDCMYRVEWRGSPEEERNYLLRLLDKFEPSRNRQEDEALLSKGKELFADPALKERARVLNRQDVESWGVCCLSAVPPHEILMWSHYADRHRGFCLKFSNELSKHFFVKRKPGDYDKGPAILAPSEVKYNNKYPVLNCIRDQPAAMAKKAIFRKARPWEYEQEWRMVEINGQGSLRFPSQYLTGVIFGCRMSDAHKRKIREWCKDRQPAITYYQARESLNSYRLQIDEIP